MELRSVISPMNKKDYFHSYLKDRVKIMELNFLKNLKLKNIIFQESTRITPPDNMFLINLGKEEIDYTICAYCFVRVRKDKKLILTSSDEFVDKNHNRLYVDDYKKSIVFLNVKKAKSFLKNEIIVNAYINSIGDLILEFSNDYYIELSIDCCINFYEYYRILELKTDKTKLIVKYINDEVTLEM